MSKIFKKLAFPPQSFLTCAGCEQPFDPNYNSTTCKLYHLGGEMDRIHKFCNGSRWQCG